MNTGRGWFIPLAGFWALFTAYQFHPGWVDDVRGWMAGGSEPHKGAGGWTADKGSHQPQPVARDTRDPRRVALVIGNEAYGPGGWSKVPSGQEDAEAVARVLERELRFDRVIKKTDLGREALVDAIEEFEGALNPGDTAFFYYSGHGAAAGDANYLIPTDAKDVTSARKLRTQGVALDEVMHGFERRRTGLNVVVLDACRNNPLSKAYGGGIGLKGVQRIPPRAENVIAFAAAPGATARAAGDGELSPYTAALVAELPKQQPIHRLFGAVRERVVRATDYAQRPWLNVELGITPRYLGAVATPGSQSTVSDPEVVDASGPDDELSRLLSRCREHLNKQRYTHPEDANALLCYREVLARDPDNADARRAFATMTAFYIESAEAALAEGKRDRVRDRIARLRRIDPTSPAAREFEASLGRLGRTSASCDPSSGCVLTRFGQVRVRDDFNHNRSFISLNENPAVLVDGFVFFLATEMEEVLVFERTDTEKKPVDLIVLTEATGNGCPSVLRVLEVSSEHLRVTPAFTACTEDWRIVFNEESLLFMFCSFVEGSNVFRDMCIYTPGEAFSCSPRKCRKWFCEKAGQPFYEVLLAPNTTDNGVRPISQVGH